MMFFQNLCRICCHFMAGLTCYICTIVIFMNNANSWSVNFGTQQKNHFQPFLKKNCNCTDQLILLMILISYNFALYSRTIIILL